MPAVESVGFKSWSQLLVAVLVGPTLSQFANQPGVVLLLGELVLLSGSSTLAGQCVSCTCTCCVSGCAWSCFVDFKIC